MKKDFLFENEVTELTANQSQIHSNNPTFVSYRNVKDPGGSGGYIPLLVINLEDAKKFVDNTLNQMLTLWPKTAQFIGSKSGDKSTQILITTDPAIDTMATDGIDVFINPCFLWQLAHLNVRNVQLWDPMHLDYKVDIDKIAVWPVSCTANQFVLMHELYHCMFRHFAREVAFKDKHPEINFDHKLANIVQDQEINSQLMPFLKMDVLPSKKILHRGGGAAIVELIPCGGIWFKDSAPGTPLDELQPNEVPHDMYVEMYDILQFTEEGLSDTEIADGKTSSGINLAASVKKEYVERKYPTEKYGTWESMYLYFEKHGWPAWMKGTAKKKGENGGDGPGGPGGPGGDPGPDQNNNKMPNDQDKYDAGYEDGYYGKNADPSLANDPDYKWGYGDGNSWAEYDRQNNTDVNSPEYQAGVEAAENGEVFEHLSYCLNAQDYKNKKELIESSQILRTYGYLCEWRNIDTSSPAYRAGVESVLKKRASQSGQGGSNNPSNEIDQQGKTRGGEPNPENGSQGKTRGGNQGQEGQNDKNQGNGQGKTRGGNQGQQSGQQSGQDGNQGQQSGQDGNQGKGGRRRGPHQGRDKNGNPIDMPNQEQQGGGQGGGRGQGGDWNDLSASEKEQIQQAIENGSVKTGNPGEGIKNLPKELQDKIQDCGNAPNKGLNETDDMISQEIGDRIRAKLGKTRLGDDAVDRNKYYDDRIRQMGGQMLPNMDARNQPVGKMPGNGYCNGVLAINNLITDSFAQATDWRQKLRKYIKGAFKATREAWDKKTAEPENREFMRKTDKTGGDSIGNLCFAIDQSGSMWGVSSALDKSKSEVPTAMRKFFEEITKIRHELRKPVKGVVVFSFSAGEPHYDAQYFQKGEVDPQYLPIDKTGGTDFYHVFHLMREGKVYNRETGEQIWMDFGDRRNFPVATVVCTDGYDAIPPKNRAEGGWQENKRVVIWFVINNNPLDIENFRKNLIDQGYDDTYFIGINVDDLFVR